MVYKSVNGVALNYLSSKFIQRSDVITSYNLLTSQNLVESCIFLNENHDHLRKKFIISERPFQHFITKFFSLI